MLGAIGKVNPQLGDHLAQRWPVLVAAASLPARGRPPQAAARRAGLEFVEKLLTTNLSGTDTTERNAGMLRVPLVASLVELPTAPRSASSWSSSLLSRQAGRKLLDLDLD